MHKKVFNFIVLLILTTILLNGCNSNEHQCQYEWTYDQTDHWYVCSECGKTKAPSAHSFEVTVTKSASCTEDGIQTLKCSVCGYTKTISIEKTTDVHPYEITWTMNSTHHWHKVTCIHDNQLMNYSEHNWSTWETVKQATDTEEGSKTRSCIICGYTETQTIEKLKSEHIHTYSETWLSNETEHWHPATCEHSDLLTDKTAHNFDQGEVTKAATTNEEGIRICRCIVCGYEKTELIPKIIEGHTHNFNIKNTDEKFKYRAADCENSALYYYSCSCGEHNSETFECGESLGHCFTNYVSNNDATCTKDGTKTAKCDRCDATDIITDVGSKLSHTYTEQVVAGPYFASSADCVNAAKYYYSCTCGQKGDKTFDVGSAMGHSFTKYISNHDATCSTDGTRTAKCDRCSETKTISDPGTILPHTYSTKWSYDENYHWHEAICGHVGVTSGKGAHQWNTGVITLEPTANTEGIKLYTCQSCGCTKEEKLSVILSYTVTFEDWDGKELKKQTVNEGTAATAPAEPTRSGYRFTGWNQSFSTVSSDIVVTAQYVQQFTVVFYDYDNTTVLMSQVVDCGGNALLPSNPTKASATFIGWCGKYTNITNNESVVAVYSDTKNVFNIQPKTSAAGSNVTVLVEICGNVKTCGFDLSIHYDNSVLEYVSCDSDLDLDVVVNASNPKDGVILNFSSATEKTKQREIIALTFTVKQTTLSATEVILSMTSVKEIVSSAIVNADYTVVNGVVRIK